jgi:hypothetical protein
LSALQQTIGRARKENEQKTNYRMSLFQNDMKSFAVIPAKAGIQKRNWIPGRVALARNDKYLLPFILKEAQDFSYFS